MEQRRFLECCLGHAFQSLKWDMLTEFLTLRKAIQSGSSLHEAIFEMNRLPPSLLFEAIDRSKLAVDAMISRGPDRTCLLPGDEAYPGSFFKVERPPYFLRIEGAISALSQKNISVVGSREPSSWTLQWIEEVVGSFLNETKAGTVSGGARGVDQAVHQLSFRKGLPTVVLLPSGLGKIYPSSLEPWLAGLLEGGGCFLSEYDDSQGMRKEHFHQRNRLIPALSIGTLILEARRRSGTLITAQAAIEQGRPLFVLPSHPLDRHSQGSLDLLMDGAAMVRDAQDLKLYWQTELKDFSGRHLLQ